MGQWKTLFYEAVWWTEINYSFTRWISLFPMGAGFVVMVMVEHIKGYNKVQLAS